MPHVETEKKYLIALPDPEYLASLPGCEVWKIVQTYLSSPDFSTRRIRRVETGGRVLYFYTEKSPISGASAYEHEREIDGAFYESLAREADPARRPIEKTRYRAPCCGYVLEFDLYPFWKKQAVLEIELESEDDSPVMPDWVRIIRDVTDDRAYKNAFLAKKIPEEGM